MKKCILFNFLVLLSGHLKAQTIEDTLNLKEVVITYQADKKTPVTFQNIYSEELDKKLTGQEPSFIFSETPSITNYSDAGSSQGYSYFRLRGIDQTRINITFDGVPLNEPEDQGAYFSNYPDLLTSVSKIQIQRGVGTSKNGVASYGGSIQLFSINLLDTSRTTVGAGYGSFNTLRVFGEHNTGIKNKKALYVRASQIYSDGYKYNSSSNSQSIFLSGGLFQNRSIWKINFLAGQQQNELSWIGVSDSLINIDRRINANSSQERDKFFQTLTQIKNSWRISSKSFLETSLYHTFLRGNYDFDLNNFIGLPSTDELYNYAFQSNLIGVFSNYTFSKNGLNLTSGVHGYAYNRQHIGSERSLGELYQNVGYKNEISVFTKADYTLNKVTLFADIQYRHVNFDYIGSVDFQKLNWNFINPKFGTSLVVNDNSDIYYSLGYTGREPTRNDMFGGNDDLLSDSLGGEVLFNTEPEFVLDHEFGIRSRREKLDLFANLYYMDFRNEIVLDGKFGPNGLALTNNVDMSFRTGIEFNITYRVTKNLSLINNSSFNYSRIKEGGEEFSPILTPPIIVNQEISFSKYNFVISISGRYQYQSYIDFANSEKLDSYLLLNSRIIYGVGNFMISTSVNNITNSKYFNQGYVDFDGSRKYFVQAPTNFYTSIQWSF